MYVTDRSDPKFAHPLLRESYPPILGANPIDLVLPIFLWKPMQIMRMLKTV